MAGSGNGNGDHPRRYAVKRSPLYSGCRNAFEVRNPAAARERVLDWLELRLQFEDPRSISEYLGGFTWITRTLPGQDRDGEDIPGATVFFTFAARTVVLESLVGDDETDESWDS
jgi:hypothetical protein